jgi:hypothetical protein
LGKDISYGIGSRSLFHVKFQIDQSLITAATNFWWAFLSIASIMPAKNGLPA